MININNDNIIAIFSICGLVIIESIALIKGINGVMFGTTAAVIAGIAGFKIKGYIK